MSAIASTLFNCLPCFGTPAYQRVTVNTLDENGTPKIYTVIDYSTGKQEKTPTRTFIEEVSTGNLFWDEDRLTVGIKCALIFFNIPWFAAYQMGAAAITTPIKATLIALKTLHQAAKDLCSCGIRQSGQTLGRGAVALTSTIGYGIWKVAASPFFTLAEMSAALYGVVNPYAGRSWVGAIEKKWQWGVSFREGFNTIEMRENESCLLACIKDTYQAKSFYLANCFQVRHNVADSNIVILKREPIPFFS